MQARRCRQSRPRGQVVLLVTFASVPLFAMLGLVTDLGWMHFLKKSAQAAADAAALASIFQFQATVSGSSFVCGSPGVVCQAPTACPSNITTPANPLQDGCLYAARNGFSTARSNQSVTIAANVTNPPPTAPGVYSASYWVTVRVSQQVPQLFSAVLGNTTGTIAARATAAVSPSRKCIYALDPAASGALTVSGTADLTASCGVYVNSSSASALVTNGSAILSATEYDVVGGISVHAPLNPDPNLGAPRLPRDPLASLPAPTVPAGCDYKNYTVKGWNTPTLSPGVYCGGISIKNGTANFSPGIYILMGGGITTQDSNSHAVGDGVMFYNTFDATHSYGPINISANSTVSLTAPTTGTYAGILFFQDRNVSGHPAETFGGGSTGKIEGTIYAPASNITFYGNASLSAAYTIIVANQISMVGTSYVNDDYSKLPGGTPIKQVGLVE
jgi:uncharacterized protein (DUF2147 family)